MLSQGSSNITWPTWEKKIQKVNNQILYHQDPMCLPNEKIRKFRNDLEMKQKDVP